MGTQEGAGDSGEGEGGDMQLLTSSSSAAAFVDGGLQDACDDSCSICLEPFCISNPATVTSCKHEYHVQCILEWTQRSKKCPMCWQPLRLKDPSSQELLDAVEQEHPWRHLDHSTQLHQAAGFQYISDFEERVMQHLAHQLARRGMLRTSRASEADMEQTSEEAGLSNARTAGEAIMHNRWRTRTESQGAERHQAVPERVEDGQQRSLSLDVTESVKSRFLFASAKCKESFTKTTRSLKERWQGRSNKATDLGARAQEVSGEVVRRALRRITPASDGNEGIATTSTGLESTTKLGATSRCAGNGHHVGEVVMTEALSQQPGEAV